jgi:hypothetical protein
MLGVNGSCNNVDWWLWLVFPSAAGCTFTVMIWGSSCVPFTLWRHEESSNPLSEHILAVCNLFVWLVLVCSERKLLLAGCWWLVCSERKVMLAGD